MSDKQDRMLRITGYSDRLSVRPGEAITFYVHSEEDEAYEAQIVHLIHGDTSPEGPGFKEEPVEAAVNGDASRRASANRRRQLHHRAAR